jgi:hypothetical protein
VKGAEDLGDVAHRVSGDRSMANGPLHASKGPGFMRNNASVDAQRLYLGNVKKTGRVSPLIEQALKDGNFDKSWRFKVDTAQGERDVSFEDAMRYSADQVATGDVEITKGTGAGTSLAETLGMEGDKSVKVTSDDNKNLGKHGHDYKGADGGKAGNAQRVLVSATPELRRLLRFSGEAGASVDPNVPPDPHGH